MRKYLLFGILFSIYSVLVYGDQDKYHYHNEIIEWQYITVKKGDTYQKLFGDNWRIVAKINKIDEKNLKTGQVLKAPVDFEKAKKWSPMPAYLKNTSDLSQFVVIDLEQQYLACYEYGEQKYWYPISSGKLDKKTPVGMFKAEGKDKDHKSNIYPKPTGGAPMPYAVMFKKWAYWIHGGDLPGYPASHGCVRLMHKDAEEFFYWINIRTAILVINSLHELSDYR